MDVNEYLDLIPTENSKMIEVDGVLEKSKFMRFLEAILEPVMDLQSVVSNYRAYSAKEAAGEQLDMAGSIVGVERALPYIQANGNPNMTDSQYLLAIQLRIAQESWDGMNETAADIYQRVVGDAINIDFSDDLDCTMTINVDVAGQEIAQIFSSTSEFLIPAGVYANIDVNDEPSAATCYFWIAVTAEEYEIYLELGGDE